MSLLTSSSSSPKINEHSADLDVAAEAIVAEAFAQGSDDNLTIQIVRVDDLPIQEANEVSSKAIDLPLPPMLESRMLLMATRLSAKSMLPAVVIVHLALDEETGTQVILKTPSIDLRGDPAYLERFMMEEWIARRINSPYVMKPCLITRKRNFLYTVTEFILKARRWRNG